MNSLRRLLIACAVGVLAASFMATAEDDRIAGATLDAQSFVDPASADAQLAVRLGQVAQQKADSLTVRDFGAMMVADHSAAGEELARIARARGLRVEAALPPEHQQSYDRVSVLSGVVFDSEYIQAMVADHQRAIELFEEAAESDEVGEELRDFARRTLPTLERHLLRAEEIAGSL